MRRLFLSLALLSVSVTVGSAAPKPAPGRTIKDLPNFPIQTLKVGLSRPLFRSLAVSPISAWLVARTALVGRQAANAKIVHSEGNGVYDQMLLEMANGYSVTGQNTIESRVQSDTLTVHLLIYDIKDSKMAICFSHTDDSRYADYEQRGVAWVGVLRGGKWETISKNAETKWGGRR